MGAAPRSDVPQRGGGMGRHGNKDVAWTGVMSGRKLDLAGLPLCFLPTTNENEATSTNRHFTFLLFLPRGRG
jgi:hypothetical protein